MQSYNAGICAQVLHNSCQICTTSVLPTTTTTSDVTAMFQANLDDLVPLSVLSLLVLNENLWR